MSVEANVHWRAMSLATAGRRCSTWRWRRLRSRAPRRHRSWSWSTPSGSSRAPLGRRLFSQKPESQRSSMKSRTSARRTLLTPVAVLSPRFHSSSLLPVSWPPSFYHSRSLAVAVSRLLLPPSPSSLCCSSVGHRLAAAVVGAVVGIVHLLAVLRRFELQEFFDPLLLCYSLKLSF